MKLLKGLLCSLLLVGSITTVKVAASTFNNPAACINKIGEVSTHEINGAATCSRVEVETYNNRDTSNKDLLAKHVLSYIEPTMSITSSSMRIVNYTAGSDTHWQGKKPTELAKIYERENPGWIVLGGVNGDFFYISDNCEVLGTSMQEGDFYKPYQYQGGGHMALGFFDDGSYIYGTPQVSSNEYVEVMNENGEYVPLKEVSVVDKTPSATGISLYTRYSVSPKPYQPVEVVNTDLSYDFTGYKIVKVNYETQRLDRSTRKVFVKGVVVDIITDSSKITINDRDKASYLVCKDNSLDTLNPGDEIRIQSHTTGDWEGVSNITGAYNHILSNYEVIDYKEITDVNRDYVNCIKNRTIMGFKEDGTPLLMVVEKGTYGASYEECGELLKSLGCKEGFLFDGGGSACIFERMPDGTFKTLNRQEDGTERSDGNAVLLVMRDPGFTVTTTDTARFSTKVVLNVTNNEFYQTLSDVKVTIGSVTKPYAEGGVVFDGLNEETDYTIKVTYKHEGYNSEDGKLVSGAMSGEVKTLGFTYPKVTFEETNITKTSFNVNVKANLENCTLKDVVAHVGDNTYQMNKDNVISCTDLVDDTEYEVYYTYTVVDTLSGNEYPVTTDTLTVKTVNYDAPTITNFAESKKKDNYLTIAYEYKDPDKLVKEAYILVNDTKYELTSKIGSLKIEDLDFVNTDYNVKLVVVYEADGKEYKVESETLTYKKEKTENPDVTDPTDNPTEPINETKPKKSCKKSAGLLVVELLSASALAFVLFKKRN